MEMRHTPVAVYGTSTLDRGYVMLCFCPDDDVSMAGDKRQDITTTTTGIEVVKETLARMHALDKTIDREDYSRPKVSRYWL